MRGEMGSEDGTSRMNVHEDRLNKGWLEENRLVLRGREEVEEKGKTKEGKKETGRRG